MSPFKASRVRRSLLSRVIAVWFVVLIVLPFTAPFQVYESGTPISKTQVDDLKPSEKIAKDAAVAAFSLSALPLADSVTIYERTQQGRSAPPHTCPAVLRL